MTGIPAWRGSDKGGQERDLGYQAELVGRGKEAGGVDRYALLSVK